MTLQDKAREALEAKRQQDEHEKQQRRVEHKNQCIQRVCELFKISSDSFVLENKDHYTRPEGPLNYVTTVIDGLEFICSANTPINVRLIPTRKMLEDGGWLKGINADKTIYPAAHMSNPITSLAHLGELLEEFEPGYCYD